MQEVLWGGDNLSVEGGRCLTFRDQTASWQVDNVREGKEGGGDQGRDQAGGADD